MKMRRLLMSLSLAGVSLIALAQHHKVSPWLGRMADHYQAEMKAKPAACAEARVLTLMKFADETEAEQTLTRHDARVEAQIGAIYVVDMPLRAVMPLAGEKAVERIEAERAPRLMMNRTPGYVNATPVYDGTDLPQAFTGAGVIAGSVDLGHDLGHPAFYDADGHIRIHYFCDYNRKDDEGRLGRVYDTDEAIMGAGCSESARHEMHGTHVMGIMAGSVIGRYRGMACDADIALVDFNSDRPDFNQQADGSSAICILGFKRLFDYADAEGKPCVINFSSGETSMFTNNRKLELEAIEEMCGPGHIIVAAMGNEGSRGRMMRKPADVSEAGVAFSDGLLKSYGYNEVSVDLRTDSSLEVEFTFGSGRTITFTTDELLELNGEPCTRTTGTITMEATYVECDADSTGRVFNFYAPLSRSFSLSNSSVVLRGEGEAQMISDFYTCPFRQGNTRKLRYAVDGYMTGWPAEVEPIIAVGATDYNGGGRGRVASFSSIGPALDERVKPDVAAPGVQIMSALNSYYSNQGSNPVKFNGKTYYYTQASGTSMASPVMAGAVALWLQADPTLTPERIRETVARTASHPVSSMDYPNTTYGHGQVDVYAGLLDILDVLNNIEGLSSHQPAEATFTLSQGRLMVDFDQAVGTPFTVTIYSLDGRMVKRSANEHDIDLTGLAHGVYAVQLHTGDRRTTGSTLIRL